MFSLKVDPEIDLQLIQVHHAGELFKLVHENRQHLRTWLPWVDGIVSPEQYYLLIQQWLNEYANLTSLQTGIRYKGKLVGCIELHALDFYNRQTSMGYFLAKKAEGKGIITRSAKALIDYSFFGLQLNRVEIRAGEQNKRSRAIPERIGFTLEGKIRQGENLRGQFHDILIYGLLAKEWKESRMTCNRAY